MLQGKHRRVLVVVAATLVSCGVAAPARAAGWESYVEGPASATPQPVRVAKVIGDVKNADALTSAGKGSAVLTSPAGGPKATVVLDFGKDVAGTPQVTVDSVTPDEGGVPQLVQGWSEGRNFVLTAAGDPAVDNGSTMTSPAAPPTVAGKPVGGFRFYALQLSNGTVSLSHAQDQFIAYRATADRYK